MRMIELTYLTVVTLALFCDGFQGTKGRLHAKAVSRPTMFIDTILKEAETMINSKPVGNILSLEKAKSDPKQLLGTQFDLKKLARNPIKLASPKVIVPAMKSLVSAFATKELFVFLFFRLTYRKLLRAAHRAQIVVWSILALGRPLDWDKSVVGFVEENCALLSQLMGANYMVKVVVTLLQKLGFRVNNGFPILVSKVVYTFYVANFLDLFKAKYMTTFMPSLGESRRQSYVVNRSISVSIWVVAFLTACEMVSTYLKVPLSSTLAFGGVGGLAVGLSARDIAANFLGGMLLLFNEPFTPGDMVTFRHNKQDITGRVERVGWGQTRLRGRDTRPTYVPNSHFVQTAVTNMERITHRRFDSTVNLRYEDSQALPEVLAKIKDSLRALPKLDSLSMPFRVSLTRFSEYSLVIEIQCYFATKSIDEFLALQQMANLEILRVVKECGARLALPSSVVRYSQTSSKKEKRESSASAVSPPVAPKADKVSVAAAIGASAPGPKVSKQAKLKDKDKETDFLSASEDAVKVPKTRRKDSIKKGSIGSSTSSSLQPQQVTQKEQLPSLKQDSVPPVKESPPIRDSSSPMLVPPVTHGHATPKSNSSLPSAPSKAAKEVVKEALQPRASSSSRDLYDPENL